MLVTTFEGYQVFRLFQLNWNFFHKNVCKYLVEVAQTWFNENGKRVIISRCFVPMSPLFSLSAPMRVKKVRTHSSYYINRYVYEDYTDIYPVKRVIPAFKKYELSKCSNEVNVVHYLLAAMIGEPMIETLVKSGQKSLASYLIYRRNAIPDHCIKIALRHNYIVNDARMWYDYISDLEELGKDTHNPTILLPKDLKKAHEVTTRRVQAKHEKERQAREYLEALDNAKAKNKEYKKMKGAFFGIKFDDGRLFAHVLSSVEEFADEGKAMKHCVSRYWKEINSLILSVRNQKNERVETVEVNLNNFSIAQSRGHCNNDSAFHNEVLRLVNNNMQEIRRVANARRARVLNKC